MTCDEQLKLWVGGKSVHNPDRPGGGECCPDFSCCQPALLWPKEKREEFAAADEEKRFGMLSGALRALLDYHEIRKVHVTGEKYDRD